MINPKHIQFLEALCDGPVISSSTNSLSYKFLKEKGLNINVTTICRNTVKYKKETKNKDFKRERFRIYWLDGFELETIKLFHNTLNYKKLQWRNIYLPILGRDITNKLKAASRPKPYVDEKRFAKEYPLLLEENKKRSLILIGIWIDEND